MGGEGRMCEGRCGCVWVERGGCVREDEGFSG